VARRETMMRYVFVDVDHTIFHSAWRDHMAPGSLSGNDPDANWDSYTIAGSHDLPVPEILRLIETLHDAEYRLVVLTAVGERYRGLLNQRLLDVGLLGVFEAVLMRPDDYDGMPSALLKPGMMIDFFHKKQQRPRDEVLFYLEDRADVVEGIKALGVTCLQVHAVKR
jgi:phosphoglycolate phosphatase-like HAD superfamily hydrolase